MSCEVEGDSFVDLAYFCYLSQIFVHLLIADNGKEFAVFHLAFVLG